MASLASIIVLLLVSQLSFARSTFSSEIDYEIEAVRKGNSVIKVAHFKLRGQNYNSNAQPELLDHGLASNFHEFENLIPMLLTKGRDVYALNARGHGVGEETLESERSYVEGPQKGDYRFEKIVEVDIPAVVEHINRKTGKQVDIIGHSMGGMVAKAASHLGLLENRVRTITTIGSPPHFENHSKRLKLLQYALRPLIYSSRLPNTIHLGIPQGTLAPESEKALNKLYEFFWARQRFVNDAFLGLMNTNNFHNGELTEAITRAKSPVHVEILQSFNDFFYNGYPYKDAVVKSPLLGISSTQDELAPAEAIEKALRLEGSELGYWLLVLEEVSHLDQASRRILERYVDRILEFQENPTSLGPSGSRILINHKAPSHQNFFIRCWQLLETA